MSLPLIGPMVRTVLRIFSIVIFVLTILSAYSGRLNPSYLSLTSMTILLLPYLGILTALLTLIWFVRGRWITGALGIATLAVVWVPLSAACPIAFSRNPEAGADSFSLLSWNFLHGQDQALNVQIGGGNKAVEYILEQDADIVCLQELVWWDSCDVPGLTEELKARVAKQYPYNAFEKGVDNHIFSKFPIKKISTTALSRRKLKPTDDRYNRHSGCYTLYEVTFPAHKLLIVNVHLLSPRLTAEEREVVTDIRSVDTAKKSAREIKGSILEKIKNAAITHDKELSILCRLLEGYDGPVIVCGDFNDVPESWAWRIMTKNGFKDTYQEVGFGPMITYNKHMFLFRLDQIFYRGNLRPLNIKKGSIRTSDHYPLKADFQFTASGQSE